MTAPYFIIPDIEALATASGQERQVLIRKIAACVGDEGALRTILGMDPEEFRNFYPDMLPPDPSTDDTISSFISIFSSEKKAASPQVESLVNEQPETPAIPVAPAMDYALFIENDEEPAPPGDTGDATSDMISSFLQAVPAKKPARRPTHHELPSTSPGPAAEITGPDVQHDKAPHEPELSEALFRIMVKNKNYAKALEIIQELSLNNPKKSVYFATQIRFLKKLINIEGKTAR